MLRSGAPTGARSPLRRREVGSSASTPAAQVMPASPSLRTNPQPCSPGRSPTLRGHPRCRASPALATGPLARQPPVVPSSMPIRMGAGRSWRRKVPVPWPRSKLSPGWLSPTTDRLWSVASLAAPLARVNSSTLRRRKTSQDNLHVDQTHGEKIQSFAGATARGSLVNSVPDVPVGTGSMPGLCPRSRPGMRSSRLRLFAQ